MDGGQIILGIAALIYGPLFVGIGIAVIMACVVLPILLLADMATYLFRTRDFSGNDGGADDRKWPLA